MAEKMPSLEKNKGVQQENLSPETDKEIGTKLAPMDREIKEYFSKHSEEIYQDYGSVEKAKEKYYYLLDSIENSLDYLRKPGKNGEEFRRGAVKEAIKESAASARKTLKNWIDAEIDFGKKYRPEIKKYISKEQEQALYAGKTKDRVRQEKEARDRKNLRYALLEMKMHISDTFSPGPSSNSEKLEELPELDGYFPEEK